MKNFNFALILLASVMALAGPEARAGGSCSQESDGSLTRTKERDDEAVAPTKKQAGSGNANANANDNDKSTANSAANPNQR
jgi:hypothetical protein